MHDEGNVMVMHNEKSRAIVRFKDGTVIESEWFYSEVHAKQFAMEFQDDENYSHYQTENAIFKEDVDLNRSNVAPEHPVLGKYFKEPLNVPVNVKL